MRPKPQHGFFMQGPGRLIDAGCAVQSVREIGQANHASRRRSSRVGSMAPAERRMGPLSGRRGGRVGWVDRSPNRCHRGHPVRRSAIFDRLRRLRMIGLANVLQFLWTDVSETGRPLSVVTDGLSSYSAAMSEIGNVDRHKVGRRLNNRAENSHQPFRRRERAMQGFRSGKSLQKFDSSSVHAPGSQPFQPGESSRRPRNLQTETLGRAGRMAHSHGLILTWNSVLPRLTDAGCNRSRFCLTRPSGGQASCASSQRAGERQRRERKSSRS